ncbi:MAG: hypothetical protein M3Z57_01910, partial [Candidatus Dormibacteraeota bacterium]|nr:hypothetical protein [Candidatus Dormibacteraeota bacterium]
MPDHDDELSAALREYYRRMEQQPAPDVTGRVLMSVDTRARRTRRWGVIGGGVVAAAAVAVVVVVALANHNQPTVPSPAHSATAAPALSPTPTVGLPTATGAPVAAGPAVHGFVPTDVTAVSAGEWWVLGYDGTSCTSASCTRIVHTSDGGRTFSSIPVPPVAPASTSQQADHLRFADALDGWLVSGTGTVWETHDGGAQWASDSGAGPVVDLEASGSAVYAIQCVPDQTCIVEQSPTTGQDSWSVVSPSGGYGHLNHLNVHGTHIWAAIESPGGAPGLLLTSADGGKSFSEHTVCPSALGFANLYAGSSSVLWATCATGMQASAFRSLDGGQHFAQLSAPMSLPNFASIAGPSATMAVVAGQG